MYDHNDQTKAKPAAFDFSEFPDDIMFHERRTGPRRQESDAPVAEAAGPAITPKPPERRAKKDRRRRIDPTTFEKQYSADEMEFMNAMQRFKERSGKNFPTHGEVLLVAAALGYRRLVEDLDSTDDEHSVDSAESDDI